VIFLRYFDFLRNVYKNPLYTSRRENLRTTDVQVENIVVSLRISPSLDLQKLSVILPDAKYDPEEVPALVMQLIKPRAVVTMFSNGTVTLTGPKSMGKVEEIIKMLRDRFLVIGIQTQEKPEITVQNTTISTDLGRPLDLKALAKSLQNTEYDPKQFPGLIYKTEDPNTVILLFDSGKIVCNGVTLEGIRGALDTLMEKLISLGIRKEENVCQK